VTALELALRQMLQRKFSENSVVQHDEGFEFRFVTFQELKSSLVNIFGAPARTIVYDAGIEPGRRSFDRLAKKTDSREEVLQLLVQRKAGQNWGSISVEALDWKANSGRISIADCFEARGNKATQLSGEPSCDFLKGYLTGFFSALLGYDVRVTEERCMAMGDPRCVFAFRASP
jgi:predicted hydrocarbon binding protein